MAKEPLIVLLISCAIRVTAAKSTSVFDGLVATGSFFSEAVDVYKKLEDESSAKALVEIANYYNRPLTQCLVHSTKGVTESSVPITIKAGVEEAFAVQQNEPGEGIDMITSCRLVSGSGTKRIMVHFAINQQVAGRAPNRLGVEVVEDENSDFCVSFRQVKSDSENFQQPMQCVYGDFAVQTTMSTSHQSVINILIYPRSCENFAGNLNKTSCERANLQRDLDATLDFQQSCLANATENAGDSNSDQSCGKVSGGAHFTVSLSVLVGVFVSCLLL